MRPIEAHPAGGDLKVREKVSEKNIILLTGVLNNVYISKNTERTDEH